METIYLSPIDGRKSFYNKAKIITETNEHNVTTSKLQSYDTIVAEYIHDTNVILIHGWYSMTTARHINSFLKHFGFNTMTKKEMLNC